MKLSSAEKSRRHRARDPERAKAAARRHYYKNPEKHRERAKKWQRDNHTSLKRRRRHLMQNYGMTLEQFDAMFESQGRRCAACGSTSPATKKGWQVDHCHDTGVVRGVLCQPCNVGIGNARHDPDILHLWLRYLRISSVLY